MNKTTFRIYVVVDEMIEHRKQVFIDAFELLKKDYEVVEGLTLSYHFTFRSFENVPWEDYWGDGESFGLNRGWIAEQNKKIKNQNGEEFHSVVYLVDQPNWKVQGIGGWNLSRFYSGMAVQLMKGYIDTRSAHLVLSMEVAHGLQELVFAETGVKLTKFFNVNSYSNGVVHGEENGFKMYDYQPVLKAMSSLLLETFQKREARFLNQLKVKLNLYQKLLRLYRYLQTLMSKVESPVYDKDLEEPK